MARLIYSSNVSLDGYIEDPSGAFDFSVPSEEEHAFINDLFRDVGTHLYGRRLYETMKVWERWPAADDPDEPPVMHDFAQIWRGAQKVVYSRTLGPSGVDTALTRVESRFDPVAVAELKADSARDLIVGGAALAAHAFEAGLVDEVVQFVSPAIVGGGKRSLPERLDARLDLLDERRFDNGVVFLRYRMPGGAAAE